MKKEAFSEETSETFINNDSDKIYPYCISLVVAALKEIEKFWIEKINNNQTENTIIQNLFSLLNYEILLIQQISKYLNFTILIPLNFIMKILFFDKLYFINIIKSQNYIFK